MVNPWALFPELPSFDRRRGSWLQVPWARSFFRWLMGPARVLALVVAGLQFAPGLFGEGLEVYGAGFHRLQADPLPRPGTGAVRSPGSLLLAERVLYSCQQVPRHRRGATVLGSNQVEDREHFPKQLGTPCAGTFLPDLCQS